MFVPPKYKTKNNQENIKAVPKTILEKQINQIKQLETAGYLYKNIQDKIN